MAKRKLINFSQDLPPCVRTHTLSLSLSPSLSLSHTHTHTHTHNEEILVNESTVVHMSDKSRVTFSIITVIRIIALFVTCL